MSTFNQAINNRKGGPADRPHKHGRLAVGRGLAITASLFALLLMGLLLLAWPIGRAAAAPDAPTFSTFTSTTVDATSITIVRPVGTVEGDLLIAAVNHAVSNQYLDDVIITPPGDWTQIDHGICFDNVCT